MTSMPKWAETWQKQRAVGCAGYILRTGGTYGFAMFIAMTFFANRPAAINVSTILLFAVIWIGGAGALFGAGMWWINERRYQKYLKSAAGDAA